MRLSRKQVLGLLLLMTLIVVFLIIRLALS
jgi:hypothetical protein